MMGMGCQRQNQKVIFKYGGHHPELVMGNTGTCCVLETVDMEKPTLVQNMTDSDEI